VVRVSDVLVSTVPAPETSVPTLQRDLSVPVAVLATTAVSLVGAAVSVAGDLSPTYLAALGPDGHLSVPLPMTAFQVVTALLAASAHRRRALVGSGLLTVAVSVALVSGLFDGGYSDERLDAGQRTVQVVLVLGLASVAGLAGRRFTQVLRSRT
jgi:hypothetical protein